MMDHLDRLYVGAFFLGLTSLVGLGVAMIAQRIGWWTLLLPVGASAAYLFGAILLASPDNEDDE